jgi:hypothetical protein
MLEGSSENGLCVLQHSSTIPKEKGNTEDASYKNCEKSHDVEEVVIKSACEVGMVSKVLILAGESIRL